MDVNAGQLHRLPRLLRQVAQLATENAGDRPIAASTLAVVEDVSEHPDASIVDIVGRTGLAQSLVSRTVEQLRQKGVLIVAPDTADGRRTLVRVDPKIRSEEFLQRGARPISAAISRVHPGLSADQRSRVEAALDVLAGELLDTPAEPPAPCKDERPLGPGAPVAQP